MHLTLSHHPDGVAPAPGLAVTYDLISDDAQYGQQAVAGPSLVWRLEPEPPTASHVLSATVNLDPALEWLMRCDRIDCPPGGVAYRHTHPGPGIRCQRVGSLTVETAGTTARLGDQGVSGAYASRHPDATVVI